MKNVLLMVALGSALFLSACGKTQPCVDFDAVDFPTRCTAKYDPVCGCDNETYQNECYARLNGVVNWVGGICLN